MVSSAKKLACVLCLVFLCSSGRIVWAGDSTLTVKLVSEAGAKRVLLAAEEEAGKLHAPCAIAVVDRSGTLVAFLKMDGVRDGSPELAIGKARTSALLQRPSEETESSINNGRTALITAGLLTLRGGVPLMLGQEVVGAVGVAGLNKDNDVTIANAAAAAFATSSATP
jgi:glc operon protein GlcG